MRIIALLVAVHSAVAQNAASPAFEVASVRINQQFRQEDRSTWRTILSTQGAGLTMRNLTMRRIVAWAYHIQWQQVAGPTWIDTERYDILAKAGRPAARDAMRTMLQTLLADRFHLAVHRETRQMEVLALIEPKGGHKMQPTPAGRASETSDVPGGKLVKGISIADFAEEISHELTVPVVDMTGLKGRFEFTFKPEKYVSALRSQVMSGSQPAPSEPELHLVLMENMIAGETGLRLQSRRVPVELVIIDCAEKVPVEN